MIFLVQLLIIRENVCSVCLFVVVFLVFFVKKIRFLSTIKIKHNFLKMSVRPDAYFGDVNR